MSNTNFSLGEDVYVRMSNGVFFIGKIIRFVNDDVNIRFYGTQGSTIQICPIPYLVKKIKDYERYQLLCQDIKRRIKDKLRENISTVKKKCFINNIFNDYGRTVRPNEVRELNKKNIIKSLMNNSSLLTETNKNLLKDFYSPVNSLNKTIILIGYKLTGHPIKLNVYSSTTLKEIKEDKELISVMGKSELFFYYNDKELVDDDIILEKIPYPQEIPVEIRQYRTK
jgi:hypothetical protein